MSTLTVPSGCSKIQLLWLEDIADKENIVIQHALSPGGEYYIKGIGYVDGYCTTSNTVYEFHGDFWHGNPACFNTDDINPISGRRYGDLYKETVLRDASIKARDYNLIVVWESEISRKTLELGYPQLVEKYGTKPIRVASRQRTSPTEDSLSSVDRDKICADIEIMKREDVELSKRISKLIEEVNTLRERRYDVQTNLQEMQTRLIWSLKSPPQLKVTGIRNIKEPSPSAVDLCKKFVEEVLVTVPEEQRLRCYISSTELRDRYITWMTPHKETKPLGRNALYAQLDKILGERDRSKYYGIKFK